MLESILNDAKQVLIILHQSLNLFDFCEINSLQSMEIAQPDLVLLPINSIMEYEWGSPSQDCLIHQLRQEQHNKYAELWMGTHHKGPSKLSSN